MSLYLGENLISGVASPVEPTRNIGQIIPSAIPLTDAGLHLLDGALISGSGSYSAFVDYMADLYDNTKVYNPSAFTVVGSPTITSDGVASGFSSSNYLKTITMPSFNTFEIYIPFNISQGTGASQILLSGGDSFKGVSLAWSSSQYLIINLSSNGTSNDIASNQYSTSTYSYNTNYLARIKFDGSKYTVDITTDGKNYTNAITVNSSTKIQVGNMLTLGYIGYWAPTYLSFDLKQFSITVDGVEVFSGSNPSESFTTEANWQTAVTANGVCGKFVYDSVNNTVRLPKYSNKIYTKDIASNTPVVGNGKALGLTNGTTDAGLVSHLVGNILGTYANSTKLNSSVTSTTTGLSTNDAIYGVLGVTTDSSKSGLIAQLSNITTSLDGYYYIVIATSTKTDIQVDIDEIATDLNGKADVDLTNINSSCKPIDGQWVNTYATLADDVASPTTIADEYSLSSYLPNDSYKYEVLFTVQATTGSTSGNYVRIALKTDIITSNIYICQAQTRANSTVSGFGSCILPVGTGRIVKVDYYGSNTGTYKLQTKGYRRIGTNQ